MDALRLTVIALALPACATSQYRPRDSPWISMVYEGGIQKVQVDGRRYDSFADAMAHDPEARSLIEESQGNFLLGGLASLGGSILVGLGSVEVIFASTESESFFGSTTPTLGLALLGLGLGATIGGLVLVGSADRDRVDAINRFNDNQFERWLEARERDGLQPAPTTPTLPTGTD